MRSEDVAYDTEMWLRSSAAAMAKRNITVETDVLSVCAPVIIFYDCEVNEQVSVALHPYSIQNQKHEAPHANLYHRTIQIFVNRLFVGNL